MIDAPPGWWTTTDTAKHLHVSRPTVSRALTAGTLLGVRPGGRGWWRVDPVDAELWRQQYNPRATLAQRVAAWSQHVHRHRNHDPVTQRDCHRCASHPV